MGDTYGIADTYSDRLLQKGRDAEDEGLDVDYYWHDEYSVLRIIEIDGEEFENPKYGEELEDAYWTADSYRVAEMYARQ